MRLRATLGSGLVLGWLCGTSNPAPADRTPPPLVELRPLPTPAAQGSGEPCLAVSPDGAVFLSWLEKRDSTRHALRISRLEGRRWSRPNTIAEGDSFFVNWADFPVLLAVDARHLAVAWPWKSGAETYAYDVRIAQSQDGGLTWSRPVIPHRDGTPTEHGFVSLLPAASSPGRSSNQQRDDPVDPGAVRAIWLDGRNAASESPAAGADSHDHEGHAEMTLRTVVLGSDGRLADERQLDGRVCDCCQTAAVATPTGALVAYRDRSPEEIRDVSLVRLEEGRWGEPQPLHGDGWKIEGCPVNGPSLDASGDQVVAAWYTMAADTACVRVAFSADQGRTFGLPMRVDQGDPLGRTDVVLLEDGSALVVWLESREKEAWIQARRAWSDGALSPALTVARTSASRASGFPRVVWSGKRVIFAWTEAGKPARVRVAEAKLR